MNLETQRLLLRPFTPMDAEDLYAYLSRERVVQYEPYGPFTREEAVREAARRAEDANFHAVVLKETGHVIGNVWLAPGDFGTWELGYVFHDGFWGCGYATEAASALIRWAFENGAHRIIAMCNPENEASWRLLERLGMRREGCLRQNIWFRRDTQGNPVWQDTYEYALLKDEENLGEMK